ncbi:MAG TPA: helix-turn-helix domain-containing protein [Streptomyces sp.]|nr:helix-turn-helix domain-containing protein [Streptomyces sp.]
MSSKPRGPRRAEVLRAVREAHEPPSVADIADRLGVHPNTARFHLDALVDEGAVERTSVRPDGPGRPRTVHRPRPGMDRGGPRGYRLLARVLLSRLAAAGTDGTEEAVRAGREWGGFLVERPAPAARIGRQEAVARLTALLADLDFAPETDTAAEQGTEQIRLRHCPFLELAEEYGPLVCQIHLGLMQGALAELRAPVRAERLEPFAEPDACLTRLRHTTAA